MRIFLQYLHAARNAEPLQPFQKVRVKVLPLHVRMMKLCSRYPLPVDPLKGIQGIDRILQNHGDPVRAIPVTVTIGDIQKIRPVFVLPVADGAFHSRSLKRKKRSHRVDRHRFSGPGLSRDSPAFSSPYVKTDVIQNPNLLAAVTEPEAQMADLNRAFGIFRISRTLRNGRCIFLLLSHRLS